MRGDFWRCNRRQRPLARSALDGGDVCAKGFLLRLADAGGVPEIRRLASTIYLLPVDPGIQPDPERDARDDRHRQHQDDPEVRNHIAIHDWVVQHDARDNSEDDKTDGEHQQVARCDRQLLSSGLLRRGAIARDFFMWCGHRGLAMFEASRGQNQPRPAGAGSASYPGCLCSSSRCFSLRWRIERWR